MYTSIGAARARHWNAAIWRMALWGTTLALTFAGVVADAITLTAVQSRKAHGASTYDLTIDKSQSIGGAITVESRAIGAGHQIVFQFDVPVTSIGTPTALDEAGDPVSISLTPLTGGNDVMVTLAIVPDNKRVTVMLPGVNGGGDVSASLGFLVGDTNNSGSVSAADIQQLKARAGQGIASTNFRFDLNATGAITAADVSAVKGRLNRTLPVATSTVLPPDPASVASPIDPTVATNILSATAFLYTGANPIQTGVAPGTIVGQRATVLRGKVLTRAGAAISGVKISILNHPELGQTLSRADGMFDMVVNGGGLLTVNYAKAGFLSAQRQANATWQDYTTLADVVLVPLDAQVTSIDLSGSTALQVARGSLTTDVDGSRQPTLLFPQGTQAQLVMPNGSTQSIATLNVRATEYTTGPNGPKAMPGELPPSSGYTYALELSADEAIAAGATEIRFSSPVPFYVENFVGFPVGSLVPTGFYDRGKGQWVASNNGRVIKVLGITGGLAELDLDGTGAPAGAAALIALGITDVERQRLALLYTPGQQLWRVLIPHFSPWDCNWPFGPPDGAGAPGGGGGGGGGPKPGPKPDKPKDEPCKKGGSIIGCEPQTLGEVVPVAGAPFSLHYQSNRVPGHQAANTLKVRLSGSTLPANLQRIHLEIAIAGRTTTKSFAPQVNLVDSFAWDRKDAYGRTVQGQQAVTVRIGYEYIAQYYATPDTFDASYNRFGSMPIGTASGGAGAVVFSRPSARSTAPPIILWQDYEASLGNLDGLGITGGWSVSVHHAYDVGGRTLHLGNGDQRNVLALGATMATVAGTGNLGSAGDGGPALLAQMTEPRGLAVGPDGSLYIADSGNHRVRRIGPDGVITTVAGMGIAGPVGDGGPATQTRLNAPYGLGIGPDGSLYIAEKNTHRIRRVGPDGIITTVVGTGVAGFAGDGGPATLAQINEPRGRIGVGPDGSLYVADFGNNRVRRVAPDGIITTVAGKGTTGFAGDGGLASQAELNGPYAVAVGADGALYIAETLNLRVRRVGANGIISTITNSRTQDIAVGPDGSLYVVDFHAIRRVKPDGTITTVAGGAFGFAGDGGLATQALLASPVGVVVSPDGNLYIADTDNLRIRRLGSPMSSTFDSELLIAAADGNEAYVFSGTGRHLRTLEALTGTVRHQFAYNSAGRLATVTDGAGNATTIERDGSGNPTAIVAPFGQRTTLEVQGDGYLSRVTNPAGEAIQFTYNSGAAEGLLATLTDPRGNVHRYQYEAIGRLIRDENPAGGVTTLARSDITDDHYTVTVTTALGLVTTYDVEELTNGTTRRVRIDPTSARTESLLGIDGSRLVTYPDGTVSNTVKGPDPRFGMQAPIMKSRTVTKPGGYSSTRTMTRATTLSNPSDLFSITAQTDSVAINGQVYTSTYSAATRKVTTTTPAGRQSFVTLDALGRIVASQSDAASSLVPVQFAYDAQGRLTQASQGAQSWSYAYDAKARLASRTDAGGGSTSFAYDAADRATQVTLPSARAYGFAYDASGNRTQVTVPGLGAHLLDYNAIDQEGGYTPPGNSPYVTAHDSDGRRSLVTLPGGRTENFTYDSGNRPMGVSYPEATVALTYAAGDPTARIGGFTRTPAGAGTAQQVQFTYGGDLVTSATWTGAAAGQFTYTYDGRFKLSSMALSGGPTTALTKDNDGLLTALGPFTIARAGPAGAPSQIGDGTLVIAQAYDTMGRVASRTNTVGGQQKYAVQFTYGNTGRIITKVETVAGVAHTYDYSYDSDGHLSQVQNDGVIVERYTYDANRNRISRQFGNAAAETATYDSQDRLVEHGTTTWQFNADGYLTGRGSDNFQYSTTGELLQGSRRRSDRDLCLRWIAPAGEPHRCRGHDTVPLR
ncbi:MAG: hypothetical protein IPP88_19445 [Betaproteobacteria bacterium]|nr:hypothetical protein [Betaproteobacteria bacterium]